MLVILLCALTLGIPTPSTLLKNTSAFAENYQQKCLQKLPSDERVHTSLASLLCGEKITDLDLQKSLSRTALIHIFVVSGSHLLILDKTLFLLRVPILIRILLLCFYTLIVGWQPPAVRALVGLLFKKIFNLARIYLPTDLIVLFVGLLCLVIFPAWWSSPSFQMSWAASLALSFPQNRTEFSWQTIVFTQLMIFVVMAPLLWGWGSLHPLGILCNIFLAPIVALVLLPLAFLSLFHKVASDLFFGLLTVFESCLKYCAEPVALPSLKPLSVSSLWLWLFGLHLLFHFARIQKRQGRSLS